jgi:hypothetical protein
VDGHDARRSSRIQGGTARVRTLPSGEQLELVVEEAAVAVP